MSLDGPASPAACTAPLRLPSIRSRLQHPVDQKQQDLLHLPQRPDGLGRRRGWRRPGAVQQLLWLNPAARVPRCGVDFRRDDDVCFRATDLAMDVGLSRR
jgi:hypothetical protein